MRCRPMRWARRGRGSTSCSCKAGFTPGNPFRRISPRNTGSEAGIRWRSSNPSAKAQSMNLFGRDVGLDQPLFLIAGPCVIESEALQLRTAETLKGITDKLGILFIFKSSFDKANRSSDKSFRGLGMDEGLRVLAKVRDEIGVPILTDVHDIPQIAPVAEVVDVLQTPAFLARQTDFIHAVAACGKPVDIKKEQFMAPS